MTDRNRSINMLPLPIRSRGIATRTSLPQLLFLAVTVASGCGDETSASELPAASRNAELGRRFIEALGIKDAQQRAAELRAVMDPDYIQHNPLAGPDGAEPTIAFIDAFIAAVPDLNPVIHDVFATDERVVARWTISGTLSGGALFPDLPAAGQTLEFDVIDIWTVRDGRLYRHWDQFDWPRGLIQMGQEGLVEPFPTLASMPVDR